MTAHTTIITREAPAGEIITRRAPLAATTWNAETRTFEVVFSTGAAVERFDMSGPYLEILDLSQEWPDRVPFLDAHNRGSMDGMLGFADRLTTVGGEARAAVHLSRHSPLAGRLAAMLSGGELFGISVGYIAEQYRQTRDASGRRVKTATRWRPVEISATPLPADPRASIRSHAMPETTTLADAPATPPILPVNSPVDTTGNDNLTVLDRAAVNVEIRTIARVANLDQPWVDSQIDANATAEQARAAAFEAMRSRSAWVGNVHTARAEITADYTSPEFRVRTISEALYARVTPSHQLSEAARPYAGMTTLDIARDCLRVRSIPTTGFAPATIVERALHTTSDFPLILGETVGRTLREAYGAVPGALKRVGRQTTARDFRAKHRLQLSEAPRLERVNEAGEFRSGTLAEGKESYAVTTFGRILSFSRQAITNDDLHAFSDLSRRLGQAAAATEAQLLVDLLVSNAGNGPTMSDNKALFHADHKNKAAGNDVGIWTGQNAKEFVALVGAARLAMRKQVGLSGELIAVTPKFLIVPSDLETPAEQQLAKLTPTKGSDVNPFAGTLELVVEPRLASGTRWYVTASPTEIDGLEYAYLEGNEGPQIETKAGFEVDGVQVRVRLDFGCGLVDHRGWFMNPGA